MSEAPPPHPSTPSGIAKRVTPPGSGRSLARGVEGIDGMPTRFGKYTLIRKLAAGGMAELFLAIQKSVAGFEKLLVIKRILPSMNQDQAFIEMLLHEARVAATLSHANIVQIFDVGQQDGQFYIAMEHVHGEDLRSIVRQMKQKGVLDFPLEHALAIVLGMCAGLAYAHEKRDLDGTALNIVHRDVSPQNVVVTFTGDVKIVDFGIAKSDVRAPGMEITKSGRLKGKVPYMSPEQARGEAVDARSDVFSTGVLLFELTTGKRLFKGQSEYETLRLICDREYPRPSVVNPDYPPELEAIVMKALAKDRAERYQSAREMQADLEAFVRENQIGVSSLALDQFMRMLFEETLASQKEALLQGKQLADIIEMQHRSSPPDGTLELGVVASSQSMPAAARTVTNVDAARLRKGGGALALLAAGVVALGAIGGVAAWLATRPPPASVKTTASAAPALEARASLAVESDPAGASIWINGDLRKEITPATIDKLPSGLPIDVRLTMDGFEHAKQQLTLEDGKIGKVRLDLKKGSIVVEVSLSPAGLGATPTFTLDGTSVSGPRIEGVSSGVSHRLVVSAPGYAAQSVVVSGAPLETKRVEIKLEKERHARPASHAATGGAAPAAPVAGPGRLNVGASGGWCNVTVDGAARGATPIAGLELSAGAHKITCTTSDGKTLQATVNIPADGTTRYKFAL